MAYHSLHSVAVVIEWDSKGGPAGILRSLVSDLTRFQPIASQSVILLGVVSEFDRP